MKKINLEILRLGLAFFSFIGILSLLFAYINQFDAGWFQFLGEILTIPLLIIVMLNPIWMIIDLVKKNIADKAIFNLTFFISIITVLLLGFMFWL